MLLSDAAANGRDNNFNLVRFVAALAVLVAHSWPLSLGAQRGADPLAAQYGLGLGGIAVDVFFLTSGFLVTASMYRRQRIADFLASRALRIYPALVVVVFACVCLGAVMSILPWQEYFSHPDTKRFLWKNATAVTGMYDRLPGVFLSNPFPQAVNGSLWTLLMELRMYLLLAALWLVARVAGRHRPKAFGVAIVLLAVVAMTSFVANTLAPGLLPRALQFSKWSYPAMFLIGAACFVLRRHIRMETSFFLLTAASVLAAGAWATPNVLHAVYLLALPYIVLYLAYVPAGSVRRFNSCGDTSYGIYIVAFPVQQTLAAIVPGISVGGMILTASLIAVPLAWLSWRFVEEPALRGRLRFSAGWMRLAMPVERAHLP